MVVTVVLWTLSWIGKVGKAWYKEELGKKINMIKITL